MSVGLNALQCPRCGTDRVIFYIKAGGIYGIFKSICPNCRSRRSFRLPMESRDNWIGHVTEQIYRCARCGQPIRDPVRISRTGRWIVLFLECPTHGLKEAKRHILDTIYPAIESIHQNPMNAVRPPAVLTAPSIGLPPPPNQPSMFTRTQPPGYPPPPPPDAFKPPSSASPPGKIEFCPECGSKLQPGALFCTACGTSIEDDYDEY